MQNEDLHDLIKADPQASRLLRGNPLVKEEAVMSSLLSLGGALMKAMVIDGRCAVLKPPPVSYTAGNSLVVCGPEIFPRAFFPDTFKCCRIATTLVVIYGHLKEELHTHTSHVFSTVVEGSGWLFTETEKLWALPGDLVVIPRGVKHLFNCDEKQRMLIFAVELSDQPIDHQKNFY